MKCLYCNKEFPNKSNKKFCSRQHKSLYSRRKNYSIHNNRNKKKNKRSAGALLRELLFSFLGNICSKCGNSKQEGNKLVIHHIVPIFLGGENIRENVTVLCEKCHKELHLQERKTEYWKEICLRKKVIQYN